MVNSFAETASFSLPIEKAKQEKAKLPELVFCPGNKLTKFFYLVEYRISGSRPNKRVCI
jgi:hypothetical protein